MELLFICISSQIVTTPDQWPGTSQLIITEKSSLIAIFTQAENEGFFTFLITMFQAYLKV